MSGWSQASRQGPWWPFALDDGVRARAPIVLKTAAVARAMSTSSLAAPIPMAASAEGVLLGSPGRGGSSLQSLLPGDLVRGVAAVAAAVSCACLWGCLPAWKSLAGCSREMVGLPFVRAHLPAETSAQASAGEV